jgi:hypothetical protein
VHNEIIDVDDCVGDDDDDDDNDDDDDGPSDNNTNGSSDLSQKQPWWKSNIASRFSKGREETWILSSHCAARTQMYHNLLHYKFRLLLKVRARVQLRTSVPMFTVYVRQVAEQITKHGPGFFSSSSGHFEKFHGRETERLNRLLDSAGRRWGSSDAPQVRAVLMMEFGHIVTLCVLVVDQFDAWNDSICKTILASKTKPPLK